MKKLMKKLPMLALALMILLQVFQPAVKPAEARYNYTVRIYAGQQALISGGEHVEYTGLNYGDRVNFNLRDVDLKDGSKYYVKGIRPAGRDNNTVGMTSIPVEGDSDWVIAYGLLTDAVMYTVEYVDTDGNELAPAEYYYGNVGDKPVIAFLYFENYRPNAYNLTGTLSADASENVFRFVYTRVAAGEGTGENPETTGRPNVNPGGIPVVPADPGAAGADAPGGEEDIPEEDVPLTPTEDLVDMDDIDDFDVPLANFIGVMSEARILGIPVWVELLLLLVIVAAAYSIGRTNGKRKERK